MDAKAVVLCSTETDRRGRLRMWRRGAAWSELRWELGAQVGRTLSRLLCDTEDVSALLDIKSDAHRQVSKRGGAGGKSGAR